MPVEALSVADVQDSTVEFATTSTAAPSTTTWRRSAGILAAATVGVGVANYAMSVGAVRLLSAGEFAHFAAGQGLLLVLGSGSLAALPWAVARYLARSTDADAAQKALYFGLVGCALQATVLGSVALAVCWSLAGLTFGIAGGVAAALISLLAGPIGFLQGQQRLPTIAAIRIVETVIRIAASLLLIALFSRSATAALIGFPLGSAVAMAYALSRCRSGFPLRRVSRSLAGALAKDAGLLGAIQVLLAMLAALDTVYVAAGHFTSEQAASYQAAALVARIPLFFSAAVSSACYTGLAAAPTESAAGIQIRGALRTYAWLCVPLLVASLTLPHKLLDLVVPAAYLQTMSTLRVLAVAGVLIGAINVLTTAHQARGKFRRCIWLLAGGVGAQAAGLLAVGATGQLRLFVLTELAVSVATFVALVVDGWLWLARPTLHIRWQVPVVIGVGVAAAFAARPWEWLLVMAALSAVAVSAAFREAGAPRSARHRRTSEESRIQAFPAPPRHRLSPSTPNQRITHD